MTVEEAIRKGYRKRLPYKYTYWPDPNLPSSASQEDRGAVAPLKKRKGKWGGWETRRGNRKEAENHG